MTIGGDRTSEPSTMDNPGNLVGIEQRAIQPGVSEGELGRFCALPEAERVQRLEADGHLVTALALYGFAGLPWRRFSNALASYGIQVMRSWIVSKEIFAQCKRKGYGLPVWTVSREEAFELANETTGAGVAAFRSDVLIPGVWQPSRGASLKTFFIGQCVLQFPNVYRRWQSERKRFPEYEPQQLPTSALAVLEVNRIEALPRDSELGMRLLKAKGFTAHEIAAATGVSKRVVESKMQRGREAINGGH